MSILHTLYLMQTICTQKLIDTDDNLSKLNDESHIPPHLQIISEYCRKAARIVKQIIPNKSQGNNQNISHWQLNPVMASLSGLR